MGRRPRKDTRCWWKPNAEKNRIEMVETGRLFRCVGVGVGQGTRRGRGRWSWSKEWGGGSAGFFWENNMGGEMSPPWSLEAAAGKKGRGRLAEEGEKRRKEGSHFTGTSGSKTGNASFPKGGWHSFVSVAAEKKCQREGTKMRPTEYRERKSRERSRQN